VHPRRVSKSETLFGFSIEPGDFPVGMMERNGVCIACISNNPCGYAFWRRDSTLEKLAAQVFPSPRTSRIFPEAPRGPTRSFAKGMLFSLVRYK